MFRVLGTYNFACKYKMIARQLCDGLFHIELKSIMKTRQDNETILHKLQAYLVGYAQPKIVYKQSLTKTTTYVRP